MEDKGELTFEDGREFAKSAEDPLDWKGTFNVEKDREVFWEIDVGARGCEISVGVWIGTGDGETCFEEIGEVSEEKEELSAEILFGDLTLPVPPLSIAAFKSKKGSRVCFSFCTNSPNFSIRSGFVGSVSLLDSVFNLGLFS